MLAWLVVLILIVGEGVGLAWWLRKEFYPLFFRGWVALIYSAALAGDFIVGWLVSMTWEPGGTFGMRLMVALGTMLVVIVFLGTLFVRWVVAHDMTDIPKSKR